MSTALQRRTAVAVAPRARSWLRRGGLGARILNVFAPACNLIDERGEVLSLVSRQVGAGPFSLVLDGELDFRGLIGEKTQLVVYPEGLLMGDLVVDASQAQVWQPRPDWEWLRAGRERLVARLPQVKSLLLESAPAGSLVDMLREPVHVGAVAGRDPAAGYGAGWVAAAQLPVRQLIDGLAEEDLDGLRRAARRLAGLGPGLTPAGDDFLLGAAYALWVLYPVSRAEALVAALLSPAIPLTASLSAAWLRAAGCGEAGERWHDFLEVLVWGPPQALGSAVESLISSGHTSGADSLAGFCVIVSNWEDLRSNGCLS